MLKLSLIVTLAALLPFALAAPAQSEDMVMTPGGLRPKSSVIQIPEGGSLSLTETEIHLLDAAKNVIHVAPRSKEKVGPPATVPAKSGWISWAQWHRTSSPILNFVTTWTVPPNPVTNHGQTVFLFNGLEPEAGTAIIQPVLQWGPSAAGGGPRWQTANWYVSSARTFFTPLQNVAVGQSLQGVIRRTAQNTDGSFNYTSQFAGGTVLSLNSSPELPWAFETLEGYNVNTPSTDYPKGCTAFSGIGLTTSAGTAPVKWTIINDDPEGIRTTINVDGGVNGRLTTCYPSQ